MDFSPGFRAIARILLRVNYHGLKAVVNDALPISNLQFIHPLTMDFSPGFRAIARILLRVNYHGLKAVVNDALPISNLQFIHPLTMDFSPWLNRLTSHPGL